MSLALLLPLGLAALAALAVPIVIHLVRRPEQHVIDFAALRWLSERVHPRRRLRLDDLWLLLVRLLLIAALAVLLAQPVLDRDGRAARAWIVVAPTVGLDAARAALADRPGEWRWLAPGFPSVETPLPAGEVPLASLVRELDASLDAHVALTVVVPELLDGLDGERIAVTRAIDWQVVAVEPGADPATGSVPGSAARMLAVRHAADAEAPLRFIRAAVAAWNADEAGRYTLDVRSDDAAIPGDAHWLVWLGGELPAAAEAWVRAGGRALVVGDDRDHGDVVVWRDAGGDALARAQALGAGRLVRLARAVDVQALPQLLDADFPLRLRALFEDAPRPPMRAPASIVSPHTGAAPSTRPPVALDPLLIVLVAGLFFLERALAMRRRGAA